MSTNPVHWGAYSGDLLEKVMAVFVAQDHPKTIRRTPSSGDGGVDLLVPIDGGWHVKQVKGFSDRIGSNERRQIQNSYDVLLDNPRLSQPVLEWRLTVPVDPTSGEQEWFDELTADAPFDVWWEGEVYWHGYAARHPHVTDYYLEGGRERVAKRAAGLLETAKALQRPITPSEVSGRLAELAESLNNDDPHYRYDFETRGSPLEIPATPRSGAVLSVSGPIAGGGALVTHVIAKHRYSTADSPIGGTLTARIVDPDLGVDLRDDLENFRRYGTALEFPIGLVDVTLDAPGDLGGSFEGTAARLGPAVVDQGAKRFRLRVVDAGNGTSHMVELRVQETTRGEEGLKSLMFDRHRHLRVEFTFDFVGELALRCNIKFNVEDILLTPVDDALEVIRLIAALQPSNVAELLPEHGEKVLATARIGDGFASVDPQTASLIEDLHILQTHVPDIVVIPDVVSEGSISDLNLAARLIRDRRIEGHHVMVNIECPPGQDSESFVQELNSSDEPIIVHHGLQIHFEKGLVYEVGTVFMVGTSVSLAEGQTPDPNWVTVNLTGDETVTLTLDDPRDP